MFQNVPRNVWLIMSYKLISENIWTWIWILNPSKMFFFSCCDPLFLLFYLVMKSSLFHSCHYLHFIIFKVPVSLFHSFIKSVVKALTMVLWRIVIWTVQHIDHLLIYRFDPTLSTHKLAWPCLSKCSVCSLYGKG